MIIRRLLYSLLLICILFGKTCFAEQWNYYPVQINNIVAVPDFSDVTGAMKQPSYWINKINQPAKLMFNEEQIISLNRKLDADKDCGLVDFDNYPANITGVKLLALINRLPIPAELKYVNGKRVSYDYYKQLDSNRNIQSVPDTINVRYGFTIRQTDMRTLPTSDRLYNHANGDNLDRFQETRLDPVEPVLILHSSSDAKFVFVQAYCYAAWVRAEDVAVVAGKSDWNDYRRQSFLSVKLPNFCLRNALTQEQRIWEMGAKIPIEPNDDHSSYLLKLPERDEKGGMIFSYSRLPKTTIGVREGFLPCSYQNIIYQAFKMYGMRFGWGGLYDSVDCSSFAQNVYRSFGIYLPRNSGQQAKMPVYTREFYGIGGSRYDELSTVAPGSILYMPGHIMIYLGCDRDRHYIIHSFSSFGVLDKKLGIEENPVYAVAVTSMNIYRMSGRSFQDAVNLGKTIQ